MLQPLPHLAYLPHNRNTEVSQAIFEYSRWHCRSVYVTQPMAMLAVEALMIIKRKNRLSLGTAQDLRGTQLQR